MVFIAADEASGAYYRHVSWKDMQHARASVRFLAIWVLCTVLSIALGLASVHYNWYGIPVHFGGANLLLSIYPPLTICSLLALWFGFWWGAIPAYLATFCLSIYFHMAPGWAAIFALSDPLAFAVFVVGYRATSASLHLRSLDTLLSYTILLFLGGVLSSVGTFIWSYTGHLPPQATFDLWQGWWVGYVVQSLLVSAPILALFSQRVCQWRDREFPANQYTKIKSQQAVILSVIMLLGGVYLFIALSVRLSRNIIHDTGRETLQHLLEDQHLLEAMSTAVYLVLGILFFALTYLGYHLVMNWSRKLQQAILDAELATQAKSGFLARMSHEIRTPMNAIIGLSELALQKASDTRQKDYLTKIRASSDILLSLINDILDFSKSDAGKLQLEARIFRLEDSLGRICDQIALKANEKGLDLFIEVSPEVPVQLVGDKLKLEQVLLNLLSNATKFTASGNITLRVNPVSTDAQEIELLFRVTDTGIGIPAARVNALFQPFTQVDESITRHYGGTGLGLAICRQIVNAMGGRIWVESKEGEGSTFYFTVRAGLPELDAESSAIPANRQAALTGKTAILTFQQAELQYNLTKYLGQFGIQVILNNTLHDTLEQIDAGHLNADILIADLDNRSTTELRQLSHLQQANGSPLPVLLLAAPFSTSVDLELPDIQQQHVRVLSTPLLPGRLYVALCSSLVQEQFTGRRLADKQSAFSGTISDEYRHLYKRRVLVVEDDPINSQIAEELLHAVGAYVDTASNGTEALHKVKNTTYDMVLMDIHMPVMDGITAAQYIRKSGDLSLPIIALTAHSLQEAQDVLADSGMDDVLSKPFLPAQLYSIMAKHLSDRPARASDTAPADIVLTGDASFQLPILPGIDLLKGQKTVGLKPDRYLNILKKFNHHHSNTASDLRLAFADNNLKEVHRLAHSLRSVGRSIGADRLHQTASALEIGAANNQVEEDMVNDLAMALEEALVSLSKLENA
ncbi:ATP-binding protein [Leeia oryzae]|uniref:ATP-binding protein n=1 Tax=Leeia oryzae TaxID=356662 RepID=UPI00039B8915|nr:ATP-binding protein [Leeia oryzae]